MEPLRGLTDLDLQASSINEHRPDSDVFELDLTLWTLLANLCRQAPEIAMGQFDLPVRAVELLAVASDPILARLASGAVVSFRLRSSESMIIEMLNAPYPRALPLDSGGSAQAETSDWDVSYWQVLRNIARRSANVAAASFGVSADLAKALAVATDNQVRHLATVVSTDCTLAFNPGLIVPLLTSPSRRLIAMKYQQCLS